MQKRILLTGANGLLGQKIVKLLAARPQIQLIATGRGPNRNPMPEGYIYERADLTNKIEVEYLFETFQPTHLIHTAAMTLVDKCEQDKGLARKNNVDVVASLVRLCQQYETHITHVSTDFVFDGKDGPYKEEDSTGPVNYYGQCKLEAEKIVLEADPKLKVAVIRTMLIYGISPAMSRSNIVLWVKKSLEEGKEIKVVDDQFRCPTLAEDLANACVSASMREASGIYHVSGNEMMSIIELAKRVANYWNLDESLIKPTDSASLNQAAKRPPKTGFIIMKAQMELGYQPRSLKKGLEVLDLQMA